MQLVRVSSKSRDGRGGLVINWPDQQLTFAHHSTVRLPYRGLGEGLKLS